MASAQVSFNKATTAYNNALKALSTARQSLTPEQSVAPPTAKIEALSATVITTLSAQTNAALVLNIAKSSLSQLQVMQTGTSKKRAALNTIIRPVSDEFGFELIGHYRYGRGAYIDRGGLHVNSSPDSSQLSNQLNIQFAPDGGFLTDPGIKYHSGPGGAATASSLEQMQPDDYVTGASFQGYNVDSKGAGSPQNVVTTSQQTYTNVVNANVGSGSYIEADATRNAVSLGELSPTVNVGSDQLYKQCACGLGRANWLALLPQGVIKSLVFDQTLGSSAEPLATSQNITNESNPSGIPNVTLGDTKAPSGTTFSGSVSPDDFLQSLSTYLTNDFNLRYKANNAPREKRYTVSDRSIFVGNTGYTVTNPPGTNSMLGSSPLFSAAASGNSAAFTALKGQVNLNAINQTELDKLGQAWSVGKAQISAAVATASPEFNFGSVSASGVGTVIIGTDQAQPNQSPLPSPAIVPYQTLAGLSNVTVSSLLLNPTPAPTQIPVGDTPGAVPPKTSAP